MADSWDLVAQKVGKRLSELGWTRAEAARHSGVSDSTWRKLLRGLGATVKAPKLAAMSRSLGWTDNSLGYMGAGGVTDPALAPPTDGPPSADVRAIAEKAALVASTKRRVIEALLDDWLAETGR